MPNIKYQICALVQVYIVLGIGIVFLFAKHSINCGDIEMNRLEILEEVYGKCEWSESALTNLLRVMELTRQDEQIRQMRNMEEHQRFLVEQIVNLLMI